MLQTQRQSTINLGHARAGLVLAAAIAAAAVVGQLVVQSPISFPAAGVSGASSVSTWQSDAGTRREGSTRQAAPIVTSPVVTSPVVTKDHGGAHKGQFIPQ